MFHLIPIFMLVTIDMYAASDYPFNFVKEGNCLQYVMSSLLWVEVCRFLQNGAMQLVRWLPPTTSTPLPPTACFQLTHLTFLSYCPLAWNGLHDIVSQKNSRNESKCTDILEHSTFSCVLNECDLSINRTERLLSCPQRVWWDMKTVEINADLALM
jgi:hypothetical protein